ncbi:MAG: DNA cytosine methyltransferase [Nitrospinae bacterium]|nr:DNA cytosine methyltransferase [Nitrospinota bacterium]
MNSIELFAGAGGLAMGVSNSGFSHKAVIEYDADSCETLRENKKRGVKPVAAWPIFQHDVRKFDYSALNGEITLVAGGPPCQPFSLAGKHRGFNDRRDLFPEAVRAVRELQPKAVIFENVKGLLRPAFSKYFEYIVLQLSYPFLAAKREEGWEEHLSRLERHHTQSRRKDVSYKVLFRLLNAADFGVPQKRERVFFVAVRADIDLEWNFPAPTHSQDALLFDQWISGAYWKRHGVSSRHIPRMDKRLAPKIRRMESRLFGPTLKPWATVRDAIAGLPDPRAKEARTIPNHVFNDGAKTYPGHTGSPLDEPAKTLKAGDHGVPGGENMMVLPSGDVRYFTVRESARLQTFPDKYLFPRTWTESMRQIGNAVPVRLGQAVAESVASLLRGHN